ncbi:hypothetical protein FACS189476_11370 [Spirochaetia bacterium]|nr:hypothetical protein FACS189476_11370 [Spirochaetia bacterium]
MKINTVVNKLNLREDFFDFIIVAQPCRWKLLKMQLFLNDSFSNLDLAIFDLQFDDFVKSNQKARIQGVKVVPERSMKNSYIIIDSVGNLIDNRDNDYTSLGNLLTEEPDTIFGKLKLDKGLYQERYSHP